MIANASPAASVDDSIPTFASSSIVDMGIGMFLFESAAEIRIDGDAVIRSDGHLVAANGTDYGLIGGRTVFVAGTLSLDGNA